MDAVQWSSDSCTCAPALVSMVVKVAFWKEKSSKKLRWLIIKLSMSSHSHTHTLTIYIYIYSPTVVLLPTVDLKLKLRTLNPISSGWKS